MKRSSQWLQKRQPLLFDPQLAALPEIGLNGAIILQQVEYWLNLPSSHAHDGRQWIYNTYDDWRKQFPFWSVNTIQRAFLALEQVGVLLTANYNRAGFDRTKWYTIDYDRLDAIGDPDPDTRDHHPRLGSQSPQSGVMDRGRLGSPIPETTTETTTERGSEAHASGATAPTAVHIDVTEDEEPPTPSAAPPPSPKPAHIQDYEDWVYVCTGLSWNPELNKGIGIKKLKELKRAGISVDEIVACGQWMAADPWWAERGITMPKVASQMQAYQSRQQTPQSRRSWSLQQEYEDAINDPELRRIFGED